MNDLPTLDLISEYFTGVIAKSECVRKSAEFEILNATEIHCKWLLVEKAPNSGNYSREIIVLITAGAMNLYRAADGATRGAMSTRFSQIFEQRMDTQYNEQDASPPAFIIIIDENSL